MTLTPGEHGQFAGDLFIATAASYNAAGRTGQKLNSAGSVGNPWTTDISSGYTGNQAGALLYGIRSGQPVTLPISQPFRLSRSFTRLTYLLVVSSPLRNEGDVLLFACSLFAREILDGAELAALVCDVGLGEVDVAVGLLRIGVA